VGGRAGNERGLVFVSANRCELGKWRIQRPQRAGRKINHGQMTKPGLGVCANDAVARRKGIGRHAENPLRLAELSRHGRDRVHRSGRQRQAIEIPPARTIRDENEVSAVGRPLGLENRFGWPAGDGARSANNRAVIAELGEKESSAVPRHVRMVPGEPREAPAIGR